MDDRQREGRGLLASEALNPPFDISQERSEPPNEDPLPRVTCPPFFSQLRPPFPPIKRLLLCACGSTGRAVVVPCQVWFTVKLHWGQKPLGSNETQTSISQHNE